MSSHNLNTSDKLQDCHSQNTRWSQPYLYCRISANSFGLVKIVQESLFKLSQKIDQKVKTILKIKLDADSLYSALTLSASAVSHCISTMMWSEGWRRVVLSGTPRTTRSCKKQKWIKNTGRNI